MTVMLQSSSSKKVCLLPPAQHRKNSGTFLSQSDAEKLVHAFVSSRLDYCNSLLSGCPNKSLKTLQLVQNAAARVLTRNQEKRPYYSSTGFSALAP
ncbi:hypothetical protein L3Q82_021012, partial [Scortum barcoo]